MLPVIRVRIGGSTRHLAAVALVGLLGVTGCTEQWSGYVYPDRGNLRVSRPIGVFASLEDCRRAARAVLAPGGDYECGLNCRADDGLNVCERTER